MEKKSYKDIVKKYSKGVIYVIVLTAITIGSVISVVSMRKNIVSSIDDETLKIFSSNSETLDNVVLKSDENTETDVNKEETTDNTIMTKGVVEEKKEEEKNEEEKIEQKQEEEKMFKEKESRISYVKYDSKDDEKNKKTEDIKEKEEINKDKQEIKNSNNENQKEVFAMETKTFIKPVSGEIANNFSDEKLTYSKTLDEWRVHQGIDILAKEGTNVKAVQDGFVEEIKNDAEYGTTVIIRHSDSLASVYKNLAEEILILPNQKVRQGDVIGLVGATGIVEKDLSPHLHFEMIQNNKIVNPKNYILFNEK